MDTKGLVIELIHMTFADSDYPGDDFLIGSSEGSEPYEEIAPFIGKRDWTDIESELLDLHSGALNFFSEAGLRFFLPAYLIADLNDELLTADPVFTLVHGFDDLSVEHMVGSRVFIRKTGKTAFINPLRYGAMTFYDYSRYRLSIFSREESQAIVSYLKYKQEADPLGINKNQIEAALSSFWLDRADHAPSSESIRSHLSEEKEYITALNTSSDGKF